jgi:hypothetical protein
MTKISINHQHVSDPQACEQLSAFCDGELATHEARFLVRRLSHDEPLRQCYDRYVGIGIALRREAPLAGAGFADAVFARIEGEHLDVASVDVQVTRTRMPGWLRTAAGGAIAASVCAVSLFALMPPRADAPSAGRPTLAETTGLRASDMSRGVPLQRVTERQRFSAPVGVVPDPVNPRVESYFLRHSGASWSAGRGGYVPYVYVVATPRSGEVAAANGGR